MKGPLRDVTLEAPMSDGRLADFLEKRTEVLDRSWTETNIVYRVRVGQRQVEQLLARGSSFTLDGVPGSEAVQALWPVPQERKLPLIPPHAREWPEEHLE
jgi:hypothetical protein